MAGGKKKTKRKKKTAGPRSGARKTATGAGVTSSTSRKKTARTKRPRASSADRSGKRGGELLKTGEVLERAAISRQVLYRYIQMELLAPIEVTDTGRHLFASSIFKQIQRIQQLNESGYTLRGIREIFGSRIRGMSEPGSH